MPRTFFKHSTIVAALIVAVSGRLCAQHSHDHSDPATPTVPGCPSADPMAGMTGDWKMAAMAKQGYLLADDQHPPTQLFVFSWGMQRGGPGVLKFLGGDVTEAIPRPPFMPRAGIVDKVWETAEGYVFLVGVRSYTIDSESAPKVTLLWETRFGCPAVGLALSSTLPSMITAAAPHLGRETKLPVNLNVSDLLRSRVDLGELKVLETDVTVKPEPAAGPDTPK